MRRRSGEDAGSATAETALALQAVGLVAVALIGVGAVAVAQLRCVDAARAGARLAARGEPAARVLRSAAAIAPANAAVTLGSAGAEAVVTVRSAIDLPLGLRLPVGSTAVADLEAAMQAQSAGQS